MPRTLRAQKPERASGADAASGKRYPLNMRTTREMRGQLEAAALKSGRSLAQEVEHRLAESFRQEDVHHEQFGGPIKYKMMRALAVTANSVAAVRGKDWLEDEESFGEVIAVWLAFFAAIRPRSLATSGPASGSVSSFAAKLSVSGPEHVAKIFEQMATDTRRQSPAAIRVAMEQAYDRIRRQRH